MDRTTFRRWTYNLPMRPARLTHPEEIERLLWSDGRTTTTEVAGVTYLRPVPEPCARCDGEEGA